MPDTSRGQTSLPLPQARRPARRSEEELGMAPEVFHVSPHGDGKWRVEPEGGGQTGPIFENKEQAIRYAQDEAKAAQLGQVIVHGRDGRIQYENTYGEDPRERKG